MSSHTRTPFQSVQTEGALLPMDLLVRIADQDPDLGGLKSTDYGLGKTEKLGEAVSRSWNRLQGLWRGFRDDRLRLDDREDARGTTETREDWLLPLFEELGYGRLKTQTYDIEGKRYPVSHGAGSLPVHLLSYKLDLDRRASGVAGAAAYAPHAMVQELLNRSDDHLWAVLSNGLKLRLLRDNASLTRPAYVEFDLEAMFEGEAYADFALLWLTAHASRSEGDTPEASWLERWSLQVHEQGTRALDELRKGVEQAIEHLGAGFIAHRSNDALREALRSGDLDAQDYYRQLLRLVYRLIFLFTAEDRDALLDPASGDDAKDRYTRYYSTAALRALAEKRRGSTRHADRWEGLKLIMRALGQTGEPRLALPALGSFLWSDDAIGPLAGSALANEFFLDAIRALSLVEQNGVRRSVDYKHLGPEELGGIYESLLELQPRLNLDAQTFALEAVAGSERKTTGSYYTPEGLIQALLDTALDPVLDRAEGASDPEAALLALKVCDPAVGSGHFLIAAAHRIAGRLARVRAERADTGEPSREDHRHALREVIARCVYGVDLNPMALELCKVNLWLEALEPGKPLSFLDHHLQVGNGLLGATPAALADGIPDAAFKPITGDEKAVATEFKKKNRTYRKKRQRDLFATAAEPWEQLGNMPAVIAGLDDLPDETVADVEAKRDRYAQAVGSQAYENARLLADAWCASFVWPKRQTDDLPYPIHEEIFRDIEKNPHAAPRWLREEVLQLAKRYQFFHWHLAFPDVFRVPTSGEAPTDETTGWRGGFDCVLGNPPWDQIQIDGQEFFASSRPDIAGAANMTSRNRAIKTLKVEDPSLYAAYVAEQRLIDGVKHFVHGSGRYPLTSFGRLNTAPLFAETALHLTAPTGRAGQVLPSGIATDSFNQYFFRAITEGERLASLYDFENRQGIFPGVHRSYKFCLMTLSGADQREPEADLVFFAETVADLRDADRHIQLSAHDIALLNPNTGTCPIFRSNPDAELTKLLYRRAPVLIREGEPEQNPWDLRFMLMFMMNTASHLFRERHQLDGSNGQLDGSTFEVLETTKVDGQSVEAGRWLPLYEGKLFHQFDHRFATFESDSARDVIEAEHKDPMLETVPRYWIHSKEVASARGDDADTDWLFSFRRTARATDERTMIAAIIPKSGVSNRAPLLIFDAPDAADASLLLASFNSFASDFGVRQKVGSTDLSHFFVKQFAVLPPETYRQPCPWAPGETLADWLRPRVLELTYTAWDLQPFARDVGYDGPPFVWDEARREALRAELDAAFFHLYLGTPEAWAEEPLALRESFPTPRDAVAYVMDTFPIVKRKDEKAHGSYRTKDMILAIYDAMAEAAARGSVYATRLVPGPASPEAAHPAATPSL